MPDDDPRRGPALAALGEALTRAGDRGAAQAPFDAAAAAARAAGDAALMARAALGAGGLGVTIGRADLGLVGLLEEARPMDATDADAVRSARLLSRLAVELYYDDRARADALSREAVARPRPPATPAPWPPPSTRAGWRSGISPTWTSGARRPRR